MNHGFESILLPRYFIGPGAYGGAAAILSRLGERILVIGGEKALAAGYGLLSNALADSTVKITDVFRFSGECTIQKSRELAQRAADINAQVVIGMGGGRALDTAKACGYFADLPVVTMPTIAATCAAVTSLSVMYHDDGSFDRFLFLRSPAVHALIHTGIIAAAPVKYLRAGMGDCMAKHFESTFSARNDEVSYTDSLGLAVSRTCYEPLLTVGEQALHDCENNLDTESVHQAVQCIIISTGLVSLLVKECYNGALAHSLYYAMESLPAVKRQLHGDVVAWGVLVQLAMDGQTDKALEVAGLLSKLHTPVSLLGMGMQFPFPELEKVLEETVHEPDMAHLPYTVTPDMVRSAIEAVEHLFAVSDH